jgi:Holliday junction resolvase RusA-like endonuclease
MAGIVFVDDSQIKYLFLSKHYDKENPRVEISIKQDLSFDD